MELLKKGYFENKKSKFNSYLYKIDIFEDYKEILKINQKKHKKANHHCFALILKDEIKMTNDSEVGSPARILLNYLQRNKLEEHMLIVSRNFGGIKLGVGGVSRAFRKAVEGMK